MYVLFKPLEKVAQKELRIAERNARKNCLDSTLIDMRSFNQRLGRLIAELQRQGYEVLQGADERIPALLIGKDGANRRRIVADFTDVAFQHNLPYPYNLSDPQSYSCISSYYPARRHK